MRHAGQFTPASFFVLRTPLFPIDRLLNWARHPDATAPALDDAEAFGTRRTTLIERLKDIVRDPIVREALFVASPSTHEAVTAWLTGTRSDPKLEVTLTKYLQRMAARPTPFGLFAGCSLGSVAERTALDVGRIGQCTRYSRIDNDCLDAIAARLSADRALRNELRYHPNSSLYRLAGRWRYVQTLLTGGMRRFNLVMLDADEFLEVALERAEAGAAMAPLAEAIAAADVDGEITIDEATTYISELIDRQVLVCDLSPIVTGPEALPEVIEQLGAAPSGRAAAANLETVRQGLEALDAAPLGLGIDRYREIRTRLSSLNVDENARHVVQVDLVKGGEPTIGPAVIEELTRGVNLLARLAPDPPPDPLRRFREEFKARYQDRQVPLAHVLDEETGIGFERSASPTAENARLLEGLPQAARPTVAPWNGREPFLLEKILALPPGERTLILSDADVDRLSSSRRVPVADALSVLFAIDGTSSDGDDFQVLIRGVSGPSGANLIGRFCHADGRLKDALIEHLAREAPPHPEAVFAEVVHLPAGRLGNVIARPVFRTFEIPYLGRSGAPLDRQLPIGDLVVSVRHDRVVLRSIRLGREVIPRMSNAHNYSRGQSIYRFLCVLQHQGIVPALGWTWGGLESAPFLPRVTSERLVLSRARWKISKPQLDSLRAADAAVALQRVQELRRALHMPRFVCLPDGDNELLVDFDNVLSVEAWLSVVRRRPGCMLVEMFPEPERLAARGSDGRYAHEAVLPLHALKPAALEVPVVVKVDVRRAFAPGSDWLYAKLYAGTATVDGLLVDVLNPFIEEQIAAGQIDRWFFIRYGDPDWHVRVRLHLCDGSAGTVLAALHHAVAGALDDTRIWRVQLDTYDREVERYGGDEGLLLSEEIFWRDSEAALDILRAYPGDLGIDARWQLCFAGWDRLLVALEISEQARVKLMDRQSETRGRDGVRNRPLTHALGDKYRRYRTLCEALLDENREAPHPLARGLEAVRRRTDRLAPVMRQLLALDRNGRLGTSVERLALSYLHMQANRFLRSAHHAHEMILCDFLRRSYDSRLARARRSAMTVPS